MTDRHPEEDTQAWFERLLRESRESDPKTIESTRRALDESRRLLAELSRQYPKMEDFDLSSIFDDLRRGRHRRGWDHCDHAEVQTLSDGVRIWARRIDEQNRAGAWVVLPPTAAEHR